METAGAGAALITGDVADGPNTGECLCQMASRLARPVYFLLGNHDFHGGSIRGVEQRTIDISKRFPRPIYSPSAGVVELSPRWRLVGCGGWPDAQLGD